MNFIVLDTETLSIDENGYHCYDVGYIVFDSETKTPLVSRQKVNSLIFDNPILWSMAYYKDNRSKYSNVDACTFVQIMEMLSQDIKEYNVGSIFAYNCDFDKRVIAQNCYFYEIPNPTADVKWQDIMDYATVYTNTDDYREFCDEYQYYTSSKAYYRVNEETVYRFLTKKNDYKEEHTALDDAIDEAYILFRCLAKGADYNNPPKPKRFMFRENYAKHYSVYVNKQIVREGLASKITYKKEEGKIYITEVVSNG